MTVFFNSLLWKWTVDQVCCGSDPELERSMSVGGAVSHPVLLQSLQQSRRDRGAPRTCLWLQTMDSSLLSDPYRRPARRTQWIVSSLAHHYGLDRGVENEIIVLATGLDQYLQEIFHHLDYQGLGTVPAEDFTVLCQVLGLSDSSEPEECSGLLERLPRQLPFRLFHAKLCGYFSTKAGRRYESGRLLVARDSEHIETQIRLRSPVRRTDTQPQVGGNRGERAASGRRLGPPGPCSRECYEDIVALEEAEDRICKLEEENRSLRELVEDMRAALQSSDARCLALQVGLWKCHSQRKPEEGCLISKQKLSAQTNTANVELSDGSNINLRSLQNIINEIECLRSSREQQVQETMLCNQRLEQELWSCKETIAASEKSNKALKKEQESLKNRVEEARQALLTGMAKVKELELKASHVPVLQRRILQLESQLLDYRSHLSEVPLPHREEQPLCVCNRRCCQDLQRDRCSPTGQALTTADRMEEQLFRSVEGQAASDEEEDKSSGEQQRPLERGPTQLSGCAERPCEEAVRKEESQSSAAVDDKTDMEKRRQDVGPRPSGKMKLRSLEVGRSPRRGRAQLLEELHVLYQELAAGGSLQSLHSLIFC